MYISSTNAASFLNVIFPEYKFNNLYANDLKKQIINIFTFFINELNNSISGLNYINKVKEYIIFEEDGFLIKKIKDNFFLENKDLILRELNPIWFSEIKRKKLLTDKKIISLLIFDKLNKSCELTDFFYDLFILDTRILNTYRNNSNNLFYFTKKENNLYISSRYFYSVGLNIRKNIFLKAKKMEINKDYLEEIKLEIIHNLLHNLEFNLKYNKSRLLIKDEQLNDLKEANIEKLYYEKYLITNGVNIKKALYLSISPEEFIRYNFKCNQFVTLKNFYLNSFKIIKLLEELTL